MASIFTKSAIVKSYPAFDVRQRESQGAYNNKTGNTSRYVNLVAEETLITEGHLNTFRINSVTSHALANNECPIKSWDRAVDLQHDCYWISACPTVLSDAKQDKVNHILVDFETIYKFQGLYWNIAPDSNNNLKLIEIRLP